MQDKTIDVNTIFEDLFLQRKSLLEDGHNPNDYCILITKDVQTAMLKWANTLSRHSKYPAGFLPGSIYGINVMVVDNSGYGICRIPERVT